MLQSPPPSCASTVPPCSCKQHHTPALVAATTNQNFKVTAPKASPMFFDSLCSAVSPTCWFSIVRADGVDGMGRAGGGTSTSSDARYGASCLLPRPLSDSCLTPTIKRHELCQHTPPTYNIVHTYVPLHSSPRTRGRMEVQRWQLCNVSSALCHPFLVCCDFARVGIQLCRCGLWAVGGGLRVGGWVGGREQHTRNHSVIPVQLVLIPLHWSNSLFP